MTTPLAAKIAREYGTPVAVIDMDRVERNIARIQATCDAAEKWIKPSRASSALPRYTPCRSASRQAEAGQIL